VLTAPAMPKARNALSIFYLFVNDLKLLRYSANALPPAVSLAARR
jgi:hypothetical protein